MERDFRSPEMIVQSSLSARKPAAFMKPHSCRYPQESLPQRRRLVAPSRLRKLARTRPRNWPHFRHPRGAARQALLPHQELIHACPVVSDRRGGVLGEL